MSILQKCVSAAERFILLGASVILFKPLEALAHCWDDFGNPVDRSLGGDCFVPEAPPAVFVPETDISTLDEFYAVVGVVVQWILVFGVIIGVVFVVWGGVKYITSAGDESNKEEAKKIIVGAIVGVVFLVLAIALIRIILNFFGASTTEIAI